MARDLDDKNDATPASSQPENFGEAETARSAMVPAGEKASFNCTYDLTGPLGRKITHGFAGSHEMCIAYLAVAVPESRSNGAIYFNDRSLASHGNYGPGGCWIQGGE